MDFNIRIFITLFLAVFSTTAGVGLVAPLLPVYAHELGAGAFQIGLIFGAFSLSRSIFVPYFGKLSDMKGKKPFLTSGLFIYFILSICYVFSTNVQLLIILRLGQGFASAMILPVAQAYVGTITPPHREGFIMGLFNMALYGGLSIGPMLGGYVKDWFNIQFSFLSMASLTLFGFLLCLLLLPSETGYKSNKNSPLNKPIRYLTLIKEPVVFSLFTFRVCFTIGIGIIWTFLPLMASTRIELSSSSIGIVVMINVLISGLLQTPMGFLADRFSKQFLIITGGVLAAASISYLNTAISFKQLFLANGILGLAGGISFPAVMALGVIEGRRTDAMGSVMGLLAMAHSLGMLIGPLLGGLLLDCFSFTAVFIFGTLTLIAGILIFIGLYGTKIK
ncbi:MAG: MFS transporter [Thermodesulfobacteriota bacterium]|nr:MFS transporter [Thermodesulfobacteriota bacterium]